LKKEKEHVMSDAQRLTLVATESEHGVEWIDGVAFIDGGPNLRLAINAALAEETLDAERLILDRGVSAETFLDILATLPREFSGDVLRIDERGHGFLSATGRGGDRVLYALRPDDVRFYLIMNDLARFDDLEKVA
jgi:hypothetical protein